MKYEVKLTKEQIRDCVEIQKKFIDEFAKREDKYCSDVQKKFEVLGMSLVMIISMRMSDFGINRIKISEYMDDLKELVVQLYDDLVNSSSTMKVKPDKMKVMKKKFQN